MPALVWLAFSFTFTVTSHLLVVAVVVLGALRVAPGLRAADEVLRARAVGAVVGRPAVGALAARVLQAAICSAV